MLFHYRSAVYFKKNLGGDRALSVIIYTVKPPQYFTDSLH